MTGSLTVSLWRRLVYPGGLLLKPFLSFRGKAYQLVPTGLERPWLPEGKELDELTFITPQSVHF